MSHRASTRNQANARRLRKEMTPEEVILWQQLRRRALGIRFRRQQPIGPFIVDFVSLERRLVVEVDGDYHELTGERDEARTRYLRSRGFQVIRFANDDIADAVEWVVDEIRKVLKIPPTPAATAAAVLSPRKRGD